MHMKETAGNPSRHLKRAIEYIMNPKKTNDQKYVKVNQALHVNQINSEQIYERMLHTKRIFGKEWGRQGYHFIMIKRNIFDRQCIYNPEDIIKNHRLYKEIKNYGNWRKKHKK